MDCDLLDVMMLEGERATHVHGCTWFVQLSSCLISHDIFLLSITPSHVLRGLLNIIQIKSKIQSLLVTPSNTEGRNVL